MDQQTADVLVCWQANYHTPITMIASVVFPSKGEPISVDTGQAMIRDRSTVDKLAQIGQHCLWSENDFGET